MFWSTTLRSPPSVLVLVNYLALVGICVASTGFAYQWYRSWITLMVGVAVSVILVFAYGSTDRYVSRWSSLYEPLQGRHVGRPVRFTGLDRYTHSHIVYRDIYTRWTGRILHRSMSYYAGDGSMLPILDQSGPMSPGWNPHGEWVMQYYAPSFKNERSWYWYGENISEGEWYLRSKER